MKGLYLAQGNDMNSNQYWHWAQSSDGGANWTTAQYESTKRVSTSQNGTGGIADTLSHSNYKAIRQGAGWILVAGERRYHHGRATIIMDFDKIGDVVTLSELQIFPIAA